MTKRILTKKREIWTRNRDVTLRGNLLRYNVASQNRYVKNLDRLTVWMIQETEKTVNKLFASDAARQFYAMDASLSSQARILLNALEKQLLKQFTSNAKPLAESMVKAMDKDSKSTLHGSLKKLSGGLSLKTSVLTGPLKEVLNASVTANVDLIKTVPQDYLAQVRGSVLRSITQPANRGLAGVQADIQKVLTQRARQIRNKARNIALDQTRKTYNNINKGRMEALGVNEFEWVHSGGGEEPRELHQQRLNGNIYSFDDLPIIDERTGERGIPGQAINCRCTMLPVIKFGRG